MSNTPKLGLPLMESSQSQPEVVYNEACEILDNLGASLEVEQSGDSPGVTQVTKLKFLGASVTEESAGVAVVTVDATSGSGSPLTVDALTNITKITFDGPAVSVAAGTTGEAVVTIDTISGGSGGGDSNLTPDSHPASPNDADDEFEGVSLDTAGTRRAGAKAWSQVNFSGSSVSLAQGSIVCVGDGTAGSLHSIVQAITGTAWRVRAKFSALYGGTAVSGGFIARESSSSKSVHAGELGNTGASPNTWIAYFSDDTTLTSNVNLTGCAGFFDVTTGTFHEIHHELELASGALHYRVSRSGVDGTFQQVASITLATAGLSAVDQIGLSFFGGVNAAPMLLCDWFRRVA